jgi:desert hedgehog protein
MKPADILLVVVIAVAVVYFMPKLRQGFQMQFGKELDHAKMIRVINEAGGLKKTPLPPPSTPSCPAGQKFDSKTQKCVKCFPASATVTLLSGKSVTMEELETGDEILTFDSNGRKVFSPVYLWGHRDADTTASFYEISTAAGAKLTLSEGHYMYVAENGYEGATMASATTLSPELVKVGQGAWVMTAAGPECSEITEIAKVEKKGLFNPMTLTGTIVVDGVLASCYSESPAFPIESTLRGFMNAENVARNAPALHHAVMSPARKLFQTFGLEWTKRVTSPHEKDGWNNLSFGGIITDIVRETITA